MPCFSRVTTKLTDLDAVEASARDLGWMVMSQSEHHLTCRTDKGVMLDFTQYQREKYVQTGSLTGDRPEALAQLSRKYAERRVRQFARTKGYKVAAGRKPNQLVLRRYQ